MHGNIINIRKEEREHNEFPQKCNMRRSYTQYWKGTDIKPRTDQIEEIVELKTRFVQEFESWDNNPDAHRCYGFSNPKYTCITVDPQERCVRTGESDLCRKSDVVIFKCGPWEWNHIRKYILEYLRLRGYTESYHNVARYPIGNIELIKKV